MPSQPNLLFILCDQMRFDAVRVPYGNSFPMIDYGNVHEVPWGENGIIEPSPEKLDEFYEVRVADTACDILHDLNRNAPFALYTGFILPHPPMVLPQPYASMYDPEDIPFLVDQHPEPELEKSRQRFCPPAFNEQRQHLTAAYYYGMVSLLDHCVGKILDKLDELGIAKQTLVIFTSDHGEQLGHRGLWNKCYAYDPSLRVPLLMRWPGQLPAGRNSDALIELADIGPTLLEALGQPAMGNATGKSFWHTAQDSTKHHRDWIYSSHSQGRAVIYRDYKWKFGDWLGDDNQRLVELYNLEDDPNEQHNLAHKPEYADIVVSLRDKLWQHQRRNMNECQSNIWPESVQKPTFNAQFKLRSD